MNSETTLPIPLDVIWKDLNNLPETTLNYDRNSASKLLKLLNLKYNITFISEKHHLKYFQINILLETVLNKHLIEQQLVRFDKGPKINFTVGYTINLTKTNYTNLTLLPFI